MDNGKSERYWRSVLFRARDPVAIGHKQHLEVYILPDARRLFSLRIHPGDKRASGGLMTAEPKPGGFEQTLIDEVYKQQLVEGV